MKESNYTIYSTTQDAWDAMYNAIEKAKESIYWELYIFVDDEEGNRFFDLMEKKAQEGMDVKLIVDYFGSFGLSRKRVHSLKKSGVDLQFFHARRHRYRGIWRRIISRTHRKVLIVDKKIGFIGGVNVDKRMKDWLDIHLQVQGEVVHSLLRSFAKMYIICGGEKENLKGLIKYKTRIKKGLKNIELIIDEGRKKSRAKKKYIEALLKARDRVILFSPYYFPDKDFLFALWKARKRGVRVDLLIPFRTDVRIATYAAYGWFALMKKYGVRVQLSQKMMHGKGVIVDDDWAMIGSSNLEFGSFHDYFEANVKIHQKDFVSKLKITVLHWIEMSVPFETLNWEKRGNIQKIKEWCALRLYRLWFKQAPDVKSKEIEH